MKTQNTPLNHCISSTLPVMIMTLILLTPLCSAEIYEIVEDGQVYLVEVIDEYVAAPKPKTPDELDTEIAEKMQHLNQRLNEVTDTAMNEKLKLFTDKQKEHLEREIGRANKANERLKKSKAFKEMGKKHKFKEDKSNPAPVEAYYDAAPASDDDDYDPNSLEDLSGMIDDMELLLDQTEDELFNIIEVETLKEQIAMMEATGLDPAEPYKELQRLMGKSPVTTGFYVAVKVANYAGIAAATLYDVTDSATNQDTAGFNASAAGVIFAVANGIAQGIAEGLQIKIDYDEAQLSDAANNCLIQIGTEHAQMIDDLSGINQQVVTIQADANSLGDSVDILVGQMETMDMKLDGIETKVDQLTAKVDAMNEQMNQRFDALNEMLNQRLDYVEQLLCTPQGARPNYPNKPEK